MIGQNEHLPKSFVDFNEQSEMTEEEYVYAELFDYEIKKEQL